MSIINKEMLWRQFSTTLESFENALRDCPDELWETQLWEDEPDQWVAKGFSQFWYLCYQSLFWLDLYLTGAEEGFTPPAPFDLVEMQDNESLPRVYTREELINYLDDCRNNYHQTIADLTPEQANRTCSFAWGDLRYAELFLYVMRHVQEHAAQLHMFLGKNWKKAETG